MNILFLTNNNISFSLAKWLKENNENVELYQKGPLNKEFIQFLKDKSIEFIISYNYRYIIPKEILEYFPEKGRIINLHISYLPWNKGAHPNLWSFIEDTPKGVTIHLIDEGLDTGDILIQKEVYIEEERHTLRTSYELLHKEIQTLFMKNWEKIKYFKLISVPQKEGGTIHYLKDFERIRPLLGKEGWDLSILEFKKRIIEWKKRNSIS